MHIHIHILISSWFYGLSVNALSANVNPTKIQICQNKGCVKGFPSRYDGGLVQTINDLIPDNPNGDGDVQTGGPVVVEATGCLSQCSNGPNVCANGRVFGKVDGIQMAAAILDVGADIDSPGVLMAAIEDMAMACKATKVTNKIALLDKAVQSLQDEGFGQSTAMAHALILRVNAHLDSIPQNIDEALRDAIQAVDINELDGRGWRVLADAREASGDVTVAIDAVSKWASKNPSFSTKAKNEVGRLSSKL